MQEDNHVLQIEYTEDDYTAAQKYKGNKGYTNKNSSGHIQQNNEGDTNSRKNEKKKCKYIQKINYK